MRPEISIVVVYYNTPKEITWFIKSIKRAIENVSYEIIIVDNASTKKIPTSVTKNPSIKIVCNKLNYGYGKAINQGEKVARGKILLLTNSDVIFHDEAISSMYKRINSDLSIGVLGPQYVNIKGEILQSINGMPFLPDALFVFSFLNKVFPNNAFSKRYWLYDLDKTVEHEVGYVGGACLMLRKKTFTQIGGFDEQFFMYFEEADLCYRISQEGYKVLFFPKAKIVHLIGKSNNDKTWIQAQFEQSRFMFLKKYHNAVAAIFAECFLRVSAKASSLPQIIKN